jgi:hypothetical protein
VKSERFRDSIICAIGAISALSAHNDLMGRAKNPIQTNVLYILGGTPTPDNTLASKTSGIQIFRHPTFGIQPLASKTLASKAFGIQNLDIQNVANVGFGVKIG